MVMARHELDAYGRDRWARLRAPDARGRVLGRWRQSVPSRLFGLAFVGVFLVMGTLLVADGAETSDRVSGAVMLVVAPAVSWLIFVRPYLVLTDEQVVVQNALVAFVVPLADVQHAEAGGWGVLIAVRGRHAPVTAMAVVKANISFLTGRRVRADHVADVITQAAHEAAKPPAS
ncbi:MAG: hypothetical protein ACOH2F_20225 [Cellulomonas sp.]